MRVGKALQIRSLIIMSIFIYLIFLIVCSTLTNALIQIQTEPIKDSILLDEIALYNITIQNYESREITVYLSPGSDVRWLYITKPLVINIKPLANITVLLEVMPKKSLLLEGILGPGSYKIPIIARYDKSRIETSVNLRIKSYTELKKEYLPAVRLGVEIAQQIDPRDKGIPIDLFISNRNLLNLSDLNLLLKSELFEKQLKISLKPLQDFNTRIIFPVDKQQKPGKYTLKVYIMLNNETLGQVSKEFNIIPYKEISIKNKTKESFLFKTTTRFSIENTGNIRTIYKQQLKKSAIGRLFTNTYPKTTHIILNSEIVKGWSFDLQPKQSIEVIITTNYRLPIIIIILIILAIITYYVFRSPLVVEKEVKIIGSSKELSEFKVLIHLKNRSAKALHNIRAIDRVPSIVEVVREYSLGTVNPSRIGKHSKQGEIITWNIDSLEPFEERILSYKLKSKLKIIGGLKLKPTKVEFEVNGKQTSVKSNSVIVK